MAIVRLVDGEVFNGRIIEDRGDILLIEMYKLLIFLTRYTKPKFPT